MENKGKIIAGSIGTVAMVLAAVFSVEGGYVNDPQDPGGETNHGITKTVAVSHGYTGPMKDLTVEQASAIYFKDYIQKPNFYAILQMSPAVGEKLIDAGVNTGTTRPSLWFQQSLNALNRDGKDYAQIATDGKVGTGTIAAYHSLELKRGRVRACELMIKMLDAQQTNYYMSLTNLKTYTAGWIDNRIGNVPLSKCEAIYVEPGKQSP